MYLENEYEILELGNNLLEALKRSTGKWPVVAIDEANVWNEMVCLCNI